MKKKEKTKIVITDPVHLKNKMIKDKMVTKEKAVFQKTIITK